MLGNYRVAAQLVASQVVLNSTELVNSEQYPSFYLINLVSEIKDKMIDGDTYTYFYIGNYNVLKLQTVLNFLCIFHAAFDLEHLFLCINIGTVSVV
jgi:hypothetical protein